MQAFVQGRLRCSRGRHLLPEGARRCLEVKANIEVLLHPMGGLTIESPCLVELFVRLPMLPEALVAAVEAFADVAAPSEAQDALYAGVSVWVAPAHLSCT